MERATLIHLVLCLGVLGCGEPPKASPPPQTSQPEPFVEMPEEAEASTPELLTWQLYARPQRYQSPCVFVGPEADKPRFSAAAEKLSKGRPQRLPEDLLPCFETQDGLREAYPQLHRKTTAMSLAAALVHLANPDIVDAPRLFRRHRDASRSKLVGPFDLGDSMLWVRDAPHERTPDKELQLPSFSEDGNSLSYDVTSMTRVEAQGAITTADRVTVTFTDAGWTKDSKSVPRVDLQAPRTEEVKKKLGGSVAALMSVSVEGGDWYVALEPETGASPFAWRGTDEAVVRYASLDAVLEAHPAVGTPAGRLALSKVILKHLVEGEFQPIRDAAAWKELYRKSGQSRLTQQKYDQGYYDEYVQYTVTDFDAIADPSFEGSMFTVYLEGRNKQPYRASVDLRALTVAQKIEPEFMATWTTSSERDGPGPGPGPVPSPG